MGLCERAPSVSIGSWHYQIFVETPVVHLVKVFSIVAVFHAACPGILNLYFSVKCDFAFVADLLSLSQPLFPARHCLTRANHDGRPRARVQIVTQNVSHRNAACRSVAFLYVCCWQLLLHHTLLGFPRKCFTYVCVGCEQRVCKCYSLPSRKRKDARRSFEKVFFFGGDSRWQWGGCIFTIPLLVVFYVMFYEVRTRPCTFSVGKFPVYSLHLLNDKAIYTARAKGI